MRWPNGILALEKHGFVEEVSHKSFLARMNEDEYWTIQRDSLNKTELPFLRVGAYLTIRLYKEPRLIVLRNELRDWLGL